MECIFSLCVQLDSIEDGQNAQWFVRMPPFRRVSCSPSSSTLQIILAVVAVFNFSFEVWRWLLCIMRIWTEMRCYMRRRYMTHWMWRVDIRCRIAPVSPRGGRRKYRCWNWQCKTENESIVACSDFPFCPIRSISLVRVNQKLFTFELTHQTAEKDFSLVPVVWLTVPILMNGRTRLCTKSIDFSLTWRRSNAVMWIHEWW